MDWNGTARLCNELDRIGDVDGLRSAVQTLLQRFAALVERRSLVLANLERADLPAAEPTADERLGAWMLDVFRLFRDRLLAILADDGDLARKEVAFNGLMQGIRCESVDKELDGRPAAFPTHSLQRVVEAVVGNDDAGFVVHKLVVGAMNEFADVYVYGLRAIERIDGAAHFWRLFPLLAQVDVPDAPCSSCFVPNLRMGHGRRAAFSRAWLGLLRHAPAAGGNQGLVLQIVGRRVIGHLESPGLLIDYFTAACESGSGSGSSPTLGLQALDGLFVLITRHALDYPAFFDRLYERLDGSLFHREGPYYRRFLRLFDRAMTSTMVPAYVAAAYTKRLMQLALTAPSHRILWILPCCYNLLKRHPGCTVLIHRAPGSGERDYDPSAPLAGANALGSSLWEITALESHVVPAVARMARLFRQKLTKPEFPLEDFEDCSCRRLVEEELGHRFSRPPALHPTLAQSFLQAAGQ